MRVPAALRGGHDVVLDTMVFVYLFEDHPKYSATCEEIIGLAGAGSFRGLVTPVTAAELIVKPLELKRPDIAERYRSAMNAMKNVKWAEFDAETGFMAGALRAKYGMPLPAMIQIAVALKSARPCIVTNDRALCRVKELDIVLVEALTK